MTAPYLTNHMLERATALRERGLSLARIAVEIGAGSAKALSWHFLKLGVEPPKPPPLRLDYHLQCPVLKRGKHVVRAFTPEEDARLLDLERLGLGYSAIGRVLGRKSNSIHGRLMTLARRQERAAG